MLCNFSCFKKCRVKKEPFQSGGRKTIAKEKLVELVNIQQRYTEEANHYISERLNSLDDSLGKASHEEKLSYITTYQELQQYLDVTYHSSAENIGWLSSLDIDTRDVEKTLRERINQRLRLLSASLEYLKQQISVINNQIKSSPESEKANLQLALLLLSSGWILSPKAYVQWWGLPINLR